MTGPFRCSATSAGTRRPRGATWNRCRTPCGAAPGWAGRGPRPRQVAALALEPRSPDYLGPLPALPPDVLIDLTRRDPCALVPDPDGPGRAQVIERGLRGWTGAVGPAVSLDRASSSLRWARQALALAKRGITPAPAGIVRCAAHLSTLASFAA